MKKNVFLFLQRYMLAITGRVKGSLKVAVCYELKGK